jgi:transcriptional regulator with XRE-family HTH domain
MRRVKRTRLARELGEQITTLRKAADLSVPALAERVDLDRSHVWRIEDGQTIPPLPTLALIAKAVGASLVVSLEPHAKRRTH